MLAGAGDGIDLLESGADDIGLVGRSLLAEAHILEVSVGLAAELRMALEFHEGHEGDLRLTLIVAELADLDQGIVLAGPEVGQIDHYLLSAGIVGVELAAIDGECQGCSLVLHHEHTVDIARSVVGDHMAFDDVGDLLLLILIGHLDGKLVAEELLELGDRSVGLHGRHRIVELRSVIAVLT